MKKALDLFGPHVPELHLADARRVDHPAAKIERMQNGGARCVPALARPVADDVGFQPQVGLHGIEQRRLAHAALPGDHGFVAAEQALQILDARRGRRAGQHDLVAESGIHSQDRLQADLIDQVAFIDAQDRFDAAFMGADQQAIDQIGLKRRIGGRGDDQGLVDVGGDDLLLASRPATERRFPRLDAFDHAVFAVAGRNCTESPATTAPRSVRLIVRTSRRTVHS